jgi:hypothetical protein
LIGAAAGLPEALGTGEVMGSAERIFWLIRRPVDRVEVVVALKIRLVAKRLPAVAEADARRIIPCCSWLGNPDRGSGDNGQQAKGLYVHDLLQMQIRSAFGRLCARIRLVKALSEGPTRSILMRKGRSSGRSPKAPDVPPGGNQADRRVSADVTPW